MKKQDKLIIVVSLYITLLFVSNLMATKLTSIFGFVLPAAVIAYPLCFMTGDVLTEVWGYKVAKKVIWLGFGLQALLTLWTYLGVFLPYPPYYEGQEAYAFIFGAVPRITIASFVGYIFGELTNSWTMEKIKKVTGPKNLFVRTIGSSIVGQILDSVFFFSIAFYGTVPNAVLIQMIIAQYVAKVLIEAVAGTPLAYIMVRWAEKDY